MQFICLFYCNNITQTTQPCVIQPYCCYIMTSNESVPDDCDVDELGGPVCSICLQSLFVHPEHPEPLTSTSISMVGACIPCGHCFHSSCFDPWISKCSDDDKEPTCPLCKSTSSLFLELKDKALMLSTSEIENNSETCESDESLRSVANSQSPPYTIGAYVPCGHCFLYQKRLYHNRSWDETVTISMAQHEVGCLLGSPHTICQSCDALVHAYVRLYIDPSNGLIAKIQDLGAGPISEGPRQVFSVVPTEGPSRIIVSDAGIAAVNGEYFYNSKKCNANRYIRSGMWKNMLCQFNIFVCPDPEGQRSQCAWLISISLKEDTDVSMYIEFYRSTITESPYNVAPPRAGWICLPVSESHHNEYDGNITCRPPQLSYDYSSTVYVKHSPGCDTWDKIKVPVRNEMRRCTTL